MPDKVVTEMLTPQEEQFARAYADCESATYGNATKSAEIAKYSSPGNSGWKLRHRPKVITRIKELYEKNAQQIGKIISDLENLRVRALEKGDLATAARASELCGKRLGMFSDRFVFSSDDEIKQKKLGEKEVEEARRLAAIRLAENTG